MISGRNLIIIFLAVWFSRANSQPYFDDASLRLYLKLDKRIAKRLDLQLVIQNRLSDNFMHYSRFTVNPELVFKASKSVKVLGGYSYALSRTKEGFFLPRHRVYAGVMLRAKMNDFTFIYRNVLMAQNKTSTNPEKAAVIHYIDRNKFTLKYEINKYVEVYGAYEAYVPMDDLDYLYISRSRYSVGAAYNLSKRSYIEGYFMLQTRIPTGFYPRRDFIYGLTYSYDFK
jgi:hypothetical protein